jgi:6-phosphogluconolactonase (cycloisomerase 2 family)
MHRTRAAFLVTSALLASLVVAAGATASRAGHAPGAVYTLTNAASGNAVAVFDRAADGTLTPTGTVASGGLGTGALLGSQGAVILSDNGRSLYAVNAGSSSISEFEVAGHGLRLGSTVSSGGTTPISLTLHGRFLYVLNAGGSGNISGFVAGEDGLRPLAGSTRPLGAGSSGPAQVSFAPDGETLVVTEKGSSTIDTYRVGRDGRPGTAIVTASAGGTPFGFDFDRRGHLLVSEATGSASSYRIEDGVPQTISGAVTTHQAAPCWLVTSKNGRYAYTANGGSGTISGFAVGHDGNLSLLDPSGITADLGAGSHPLDEAISGNGRFLYNLTDGKHTVSAFRVAEDGSLAPLGTAGVLPPGAEGIAAS